jgi:hypothetical protein
MKRHIIVEGCDNCGKSTLVGKISEELDYPITFSCRSIPRGEQIQWMAKELNDNGKIFDRFPLISESVYGPTLRGNSKIDMLGKDGFYDILARIVIPKNPIILFCDPGFEAVKKTIKDREQYRGVTDNLEELYDSFQLVRFLMVNNTGLQVMLHDYTQEGSTESIINILREAINL